LIKEVVGLGDMLSLEELEFYDNRIKEVENVGHLTSLR
jgi:hypothetical protein